MNLNRNIFTIVSLFITHLPHCFSSNFHARITEFGIEALIQNLKSWVSDNLVQDNPILRNFEMKETSLMSVKLGDMRTNSLHISDIRLRFDNQNRAALDLVNVSLSVKTEWSSKSILGIVVNGSAVTTIKEAFLSLWYIRPINYAGLPYINPNLTCDVALIRQNFNVKFTGRNGALLNLIQGFFNQQMWEMTKDILCDEAVFLLEKYLAENLAELLFDFKILKESSRLDYIMTSAPELRIYGLSTSHKGSASSGSERMIDFDPNVFLVESPVFQTTGEQHMVQMIIKEELINSLLLQIYNSGTLRAFINPETVSKNVQNMLSLACYGYENEFCVGEIFPALASAYPNATTEYILNATAPPTLQISNGVALMTVPGNIDVHVRKSDHQAFSAFSLGVRLTYHLHFTLDPYGKVSVSEVSTDEIEISKSTSYDNYGQDPIEFSRSQIYRLVNGINDQIILDLIKNVGMEGFPIPKKRGMVFEDSEIFIRDNLIVVNSNLARNPFLWLVDY